MALKRDPFKVFILGLLIGLTSGCGDENDGREKDSEVGSSQGGIGEQGPAGEKGEAGDDGASIASIWGYTLVGDGGGLSAPDISGSQSLGIRLNWVRMVVFDDRGSEVVVQMTNPSGKLTT